MRKAAPAWLLYFLAPVCGELLSGSAPPVEFFNPLGFITLCLLYGGGAVLVREVAFRWKKGWVAILVLGAAYGIIEEGLMVKSFFDPGWMDLGVLGSYGRWLGVNWVWSVELTIYHAIFSIGIPILITTLLFPSRRNDAWVSRGWLLIIFILFVMDVGFGYLLLTIYRPPLVPYLLALVATIGLIVLSRRLPTPLPSLHPGAIAYRFQFGLFGFIATLLFFITAWVLPNLPIPPLLPIALFGILLWIGGYMIWHMAGRGNWKDRHLASLASGALCFFVLLAPLTEMDKTRSDDPSGMGLVGLVMLVFLIFVNWLVGRSEKPVQDG